MSTRYFLCFVHRWYFLRKAVSFSLAAKDTLRTGPSISDEMVPSIVAEDGIALRVYCLLAENQASLLWQTIVRLLWFYLGTRGFRKMLWGLPPIHFGKEDGVERTLLRVACQSEPFLASPWQGDASIRFLWHIVCQSEFDELVSMASRPVDRGSCRMEETKVPFHPVKRPFCRMGTLPMTFRPTKGRFARTKTANHKSSSASEPPHRARRSD